MEMDFNCSPSDVDFVISTLFGYMCYPNPKDRQLRENFIAQYLIRNYGYLYKNIPTDYALKAINFNDPLLGIHNAHNADIKLHMKQGNIAGSIFLDLLEMQAKKIKPTVNKAKFLTYEFYSKRAISKDGLQTANVADREKIGRAWNKYKWSSPIWACNLLLADELIPFEKLNENSNLWFGLIVCMTQKAASLGLSFECWTIPDGHHFPKVSLETLDLVLPKLQALQSYKANDY